jgi:pyrroline-5-carboxylate reductase
MMQGLDSLPARPAVIVCDPNETARQKHALLGRPTCRDISDLAEVEVAVLAFKPQHFAGAAEALRQALRPDALVISIMVGVSCETIEAALPGARVVRVMPNTPMAVGLGMSGVAPGNTATDKDVDFAAAICAPSSKILRVSEAQIDDVAAVSGSGPAYFFCFCEALVDAAVTQCGFTREQAELLVAQTAKGAIAYLDAQEGFPAARLRKEVTSPGGTTQAALGVFAERDLAGMVKEALSAAQRRAAELRAEQE